jgi:hypothetical protein
MLCNYEKLCSDTDCSVIVHDRRKAPALTVCNLPHQLAKSPVRSKIGNCSSGGVGAHGFRCSAELADGLNADKLEREAFGNTSSLASRVLDNPDNKALSAAPGRGEILTYNTVVVRSSFVRSSSFTLSPARCVEQQYRQ